MVEWWSMALKLGQEGGYLRRFGDWRRCPESSSAEQIFEISLLIGWGGRRSIPYLCNGGENLYKGSLSAVWSSIFPALSGRMAEIELGKGEPGSESAAGSWGCLCSGGLDLGRFSVRVAVSDDFFMYSFLHFVNSSHLGLSALPVFYHTLSWG